MTTPTDEPYALDVNEARAGLREGLENSREMVRQSLLLIELAESEGVFSPADEDTVAN